MRDVPCELKVSQFPEAGTPYRTLAYIFFFPSSLQYISTFLFLVSCSVEEVILHMSLWGDHEHIVMGKERIGKQPVIDRFFGLFLRLWAFFFCLSVFEGFFWPCKSETITTLKWVDDQWLSRLGQTYLHILAIWINISGKEKIRQRQFSYSFYKLSPKNITNHTENSLYRKLRESAGFRNTFCDGSKSEP